MKNSLFIVALVGLLSLHGEEEKKTVHIGDQWITPSEMKETMKRVYMRRYGGHVRKEGSAKGVFVILNAQTNVPLTEIRKAMQTLDERLRVQLKLVEASDVSIENVAELIKNSGGVAGLAVVAGQQSHPALLSATEEGWAIVNVAKLRNDNPDNEKLAMRVRREVMRGFAFAVGGVYGARGDPLMQPVRTPNDLDKLVHEDFAPTMRQTFTLVTPSYGLIPWKETTYAKACEQGWAPTPTNEYQKAIWDKVHAPPEKPMKITYDKDKQKPVVK